jgi:hypothetical protein
MLPSSIFSVDQRPVAWLDPVLDITSEVVQQLASQ